MIEKMINNICASRFEAGLLSLGFTWFLFFDLVFAILFLG